MALAGAATASDGVDDAADWASDLGVLTRGWGRNLTPPPLGGVFFGFRGGNGGGNGMGVGSGSQYLLGVASRLSLAFVGCFAGPRGA